MTAALRPYVPRLVIDWLDRDEAAAHRRVEGTLVFADISGFTALTEKLASRGKAGAEEMGDVLNLTFSHLLDAAYAYGAGLLKWGGDAALLLFQGPEHAARAVRAAEAMQEVMARHGRFRSSCGRVTLRMSVGVHSGPIDLFLVGSAHRELLAVGEAATTVATMEARAEAGQILVSAGTATQLPAPCTSPVAAPEGSATEAPAGSATDGSALLVRAPEVDPLPSAPVDGRTDARLRTVLPHLVADHIEAGAVDPEHRHVATIFVEISGTDELLAREGPAAVAAALTHVVDVTDRAADAYGVTFLATDICADGGKVILVAGLPVSSGELEQRALCAAREIVDGAGGLELRAGVSRGRVFAGDYGPTYRRTFSIVGDSVNLAARLMASARPGQVVATREVIAASRAVFASTPLPPLTVKGKSQPIEAATVDALPRESDDGGPRAEHAPVPFVGRETDLVALWSAWDAAVSGDGRVLDVVGEAGMGKTRLVTEWRRTSAASMIVAGCDVYSASRPYWPIGSLLRGAIGDETLNGAPALAWLGDVVAATRPELVRWLPLVAPILGVDAEVPASLREVSETLRVSRIAELVVAALDAALSAPTVLVVGDLHNADAASVEVLRAMSDAIPARPWLLLVTRRPAGPTVCAVDAPHAATLWLSPLTEQASQELIDRITETAPLPLHEVRRLAELGGGNPLFLTELALRQGVDDDLPTSVEDAVAGRVDRLPRHARTVLRALSVLGSRAGRPVCDRLLAGAGIELADGDWDELAEHLEHTADSVRFRQPLLRDAAYAGLPFSRRRQLHAAAARAVQSHAAPGEFVEGLLSLHHAAAGEYEEAFHAASRAAERARAAYARVEAVTFLERAAEASRHVPTLRDRMSDSYARLGRGLATIGALDRSRAALQVSRRRATSAEESARAAEGLAEVEALRGGPAAALRWVNLGLRDLERMPVGADRVGLEVRLCIHGAWSRFKQGRHRDVLAWADRGIEAAAVAPLAAPELAELHRLRSLAIRSLGGSDAAEAATKDLQQALLLLDRSDRPSLRARVANEFGTLAHVQGRWNAAAEAYRRAHDDFVSLGEEWAAAVPEANLVEILIDQGHYAEALDKLRTLLRTFRAAGVSNMVAHALKLQGIALARSGVTEEALARLAEARVIFEGEQDQAGIDEVDVRRIGALLPAGRAQEAMADIDRLMASPAALAAWETVLLRGRGISLALLGRREAALSELASALEVARADGAEHEVAFALDVLVSLREASGQGATAERAELDGLVATLGIVARPAYPFAAGPADSPALDPGREPAVA